MVEEWVVVLVLAVVVVYSGQEEQRAEVQDFPPEAEDERWVLKIDQRHGVAQVLACGAGQVLDSHPL